MKILLVLIFLVPGFSHALMQAQTEIAPNVDYMNYFFRGYLPWFKKTFHYELTTNDKNGDIFLNEAIQHIDHWNVQDHPELNQFLLGQGFTDNNSPFYTFRVFIKESLRQHPYLKAKAPGLWPVFLEKRADGEICFMTFIDPKKVKWKHVPSDKGNTYLAHYCSSKEPKFISIVGKEEFKLPNPFPGHTEFAIKTYSKKTLISAFYFVKNTHLLRIPSIHYPFVHSHGQELFAPFDKYSVDKNGKIIIYYP
mgnify:FL=1